MTDQKRIETIVRTLDHHKGTDLLVLDIHAISGFADYFVICSGLNRPHVQALSEYTEAAMKEALSEHPLHVEGAKEGEWILMDYGDIIIHIFIQEQRHYYNLEKLWGDAESVDITDWLA